MKKRLAIIIILMISCLASFAQELKLEYSEKPLNEVLIEISANFNLSLSFDDQVLSKYKVSLKNTFQSPEELFRYLIKDLPLSFEKMGEVYLFYPKEPIAKSAKIYSLSGKIMDAENSEPLPFSNLLINGSGSISDEFGNFNFNSDHDSLFQVQISYLGYVAIDTLLSASQGHRIKLYPKYINIKELTVIGKQVFFSKQTGQKPGYIRLNHKIAPYIPGNGDNSIFNMLRLQPGILAAGEQSSEMIVWGSYQGQSQVNFDGITLFGLKNYNDNISTVNPYLAKDIRVHKGGFDATLGERVGAIIDITGIEGNKQKPELNFTLNNMTMNMVAEMPLGNNASLVGAYRQTYYDLYSPNDIQIAQREMSHFSENNILVSPDYIFRDGNLKYSGQSKNGDSYQISTFWGQDHFSYSIDQIHLNSTVVQQLDERNRQFGAKANYNKLWKGLGSSTFTVSYSALQTDNFSREGFSGMGMHEPGSMQISELSTQNDIDELKLSLNGIRRIGAKNELDYGAAMVYNSVLIHQESSSSETHTKNENGSQIVSYIQNRYSPNDLISLTVGLRNNYFTSLNKNYIQPRISMSVNVLSAFRMNASWGIYNQFIAHSEIVDEYNNYQYQWRISDGEDIPVLTAQHFVLGGIFTLKGFTFSLESFYKKTDGISRFLSRTNELTAYSGDSKSRGIDVFMKQEYKGHSLWISYTLSETLERFPYFSSSNYERAFHDQRHEVKLAAILNFSPFFISANYVYGTGFPPNLITETEYPYKRFDIAAIYRFHFKQAKIETGISILNLFNYENVKYANFIKIPAEDQSSISVHSESVPFTPTLFLNISI